MARYLLQASYTHQGLAGLVSNPEDPSEVIKTLTESVGGKVITFDYCFGEFDIAGVFEMPDDTAMASVVMVAGASGRVTNLRTTVLIPIADGLAAAQRANEISHSG